MRWDLVTGWLAKADEDLDAANALLGVTLPTYGLVRFLAQQAAEKALKALLTYHQIRFGRTHDLGELLRLAEPVEPGIGSALVESEALTPYAVRDRYPTGEAAVHRQDALQPLETATKVVREVRVRLQSYLDDGRPGG